MFHPLLPLAHPWLFHSRLDSQLIDIDNETSFVSLSVPHTHARAWDMVQHACALDYFRCVKSVLYWHELCPSSGWRMITNPDKKSDKKCFSPLLLAIERWCSRFQSISRPIPTMMWANQGIVLQNTGKIPPPSLYCSPFDFRKAFYLGNVFISPARERLGI